MTLQCTLQGHGIDYGSQHAHVISLNPVNAQGLGLATPENISASDHDGQLHTRIFHGFDFFAVLLQHGRVNVAVFGTHQRLTAELKQNAFVFHAWKRRSNISERGDFRAAVFQACRGLDE